MKSKLNVKKFKSPNPIFRSAPFWSWNDDLQVDELKRQLLEMKKGGMAGGFMHSRVGLITEYMSAHWLKCIKETVKYAKELKIPVYLYDEDRWPSGFVGGQLGSPEYYMKYLKITKTGDKIDHSVETFNHSAWYNDTGYLDTNNKESVSRFIKLTHEAYKEALGSEFGKTIPAIFTDEPNYFEPQVCGSAKENDSIFPWTKKFEKIFSDKYGYNILNNCRELVEDAGNYKKVRYDFFRLMSEQFLINYGKQINDWCEKNNIAYTGHYLEEDSIPRQIRCIGAAMPLYEYQRWPGVDHLMRQIHDTWLNLHLTIKQTASVCHQLGKERLLSELFGCAGQDFSFLDRKWIGSWNTVMGVNFHCPHLWLYSMAGCRKRDYPQTISYQQPWWKYNKSIEDYFSRINYIMSQGKFHADIAVLHPVESGWCAFNTKDNSVNDRINNTFTLLIRTMSDNHYDFDLCDESLFAKYGSVEGSNLVIGQMKYKIFIIPEILTIRSSTMEILEKFIKAGGTVIALDKVPDCVDGIESGKAGDFYKLIELSPDSDGILKLLDRKNIRAISIRDTKKQLNKKIYYQFRMDGSSRIYFLMNTDNKKQQETEISFTGNKNEQVQHWDAGSGEITEIKTKYINGRHVFSLHFPPAGTHVILAADKKEKLGIYRQVIPDKLKPVLELEVVGWKCKYQDLNSLTLDYCEYSVNGGDFCGRKYVLDAQHEHNSLKNGDELAVRYKFTAELSAIPQNMFFVLERPEQFSIKVNNRVIKYKDIGYWTDSYFKKIDIKDYVNLSGENIIELTTKYVNPVKPNTMIYVSGGTEIESAYILGNFNVQSDNTRIEDEFQKAANFKIIDEKPPVADKITESGYPFFSGRMVFEKEFEYKGKLGSKKVYIHAGWLYCMTASIKINGKHVGLFTTPDYLLDVTKQLKKGKNKIEVEITTSLNNLLGPHHNKNIRRIWTGPGEFNDKNNWIDEYVLIDISIPDLKILS